MNYLRNYQKTLACAVIVVACAAHTDAAPTLYRSILLSTGATGKISVDHGTATGTYGIDAKYWSSLASAPIDLRPDVAPATVNGVCNGVQVGNCIASRDQTRAAVWRGDSLSVDYLSHGDPSNAFGVSSDGHICGSQWVRLSTATYYAWHEHSSCWDDAGNWTDLNGSFNLSRALAISPDSSQIVGYGDGRAILWYGTSNVPTILGALSGFSQANGVAGGYQVGIQSNSAVVWKGTAASVVSIHPTGYLYSEATAIAVTASGVRIVGFGTDAFGLQHALLWTEMDHSPIDLNPYLPSGYNSSRATSIDAQGEIGGLAYPIGGYVPSGLVWIPKASYKPAP